MLWSVFTASILPLSRQRFVSPECVSGHALVVLVLRRLREVLRLGHWGASSLQSMLSWLQRRIQLVPVNALLASLLDGGHHGVLLFADTQVCEGKLPILQQLVEVEILVAFLLLLVRFGCAVLRVVGATSQEIVLRF